MHRKDIADIKSQKEEDYRKTLEAQTKARNQRMEEDNEIKKRPYTDAFITCTKKSFPDSMCGACARCTHKVHVHAQELHITVAPVSLKQRMEISNYFVGNVFQA